MQQGGVMHRVVIAAAGRPRTTEDLAVAVVAAIVVIVLVIGLIVFISRWKRVRGATSRRDALQRAFGRNGARSISIGLFAVGGLAVVALLIGHLS